MGGVLFSVELLLLLLLVFELDVELVVPPPFPPPLDALLLLVVAEVEFVDVLLVVKCILTVCSRFTTCTSALFFFVPVFVGADNFFFDH